MRSLLGLSIVGLIALTSATMVPGCGKQSEGERCDYDPDCEDGLTCLTVGNGNACCPASGGAGVCSEGTGVLTDVGTDETVVDSGTADSATVDSATADSATAETSSETGSDTSVDGTVDSGAAETGTDTGADAGATDAADAG